MRISLLLATLAGSLFPGSLFGEAQRLFYYVPIEDSWQSVVANVQKISILAPQVFSVNARGEVRGTLEARVRSLARQHGIRLMPLLMNENFDPQVARRVLRDENLRRRTIIEAVDLCRRNDCWGLQLDFEGVPLEDREFYTLFVREAARIFHAHRLRFSVAIPSPLMSLPGLPAQTANPGGFRVVPLPYDIRQIAKQVDFVSLMTYDNHSQGTPPGPIAGYQWVEASIRFLLKSVSRKRLFLGLGFYGRSWCARQVSDLSYADASRLARRGGISFRWHPEYRSPWFALDEPSCREEVWFENRRSLREKLKLVQQYQLAGFSAWRLGHEDPTFWEELPSLSASASSDGGLGQLSLARRPERALPPTAD